jgi:hypothetical protein
LVVLEFELRAGILPLEVTPTPEDIYYLKLNSCNHFNFKVKNSRGFKKRAI